MTFSKEEEKRLCRERGHKFRHWDYAMLSLEFGIRCRRCNEYVHFGLRRCFIENLSSGAVLVFVLFLSVFIIENLFSSEELKGLAGLTVFLLLGVSSIIASRWRIHTIFRKEVERREPLIEVNSVERDESNS